MTLILIAKSLIRRLQNNGPIIETQALYQWLMPHYSGARLTVAVFIRISATIDTLFMHNSQIHVIDVRRMNNGAFNAMTDEE
ncbi:hypothetical protein T12_12972 [Trichinella patagoniensis]|uniref:Uncharacterized protein n=1 Tax=Trichinella patagoniensis TaxID=990121 RepID=A0A0V0ZVF0_9BILA|nr:hypothetical protein T12_12972 [Trichinella patagoniensis]